MCAVSKDANTGSSFETFASLIPQDEVGFLNSG